MFASMPVKDRLDTLWKLGGFASVSALAREAGISEGAMRQHLRRDKIPYPKAQLYCAASGTDATPEWLITGRGPAPTQKLQPDMRSGNKIVLLRGKTAGTLHRPSPIDHALVAGEVEGGVSKERTPQADFPVYGTTELGGSVVELGSSPEYHTDRPSWSKSSNDFSYYVSTDAMAPAANRGDRVEVNTIMPAMPGDLVVLISGERQNGWKALLREIVSISDRQWTVKQYKPARTDSLERTEWHTAFKVSGVQKR